MLLLWRGDSDAEGGDLVEIVLGLDHAHERRVRAARGDVERGLAAAVAEAPVCAEVEQRAHRLGVAAVHREVQWCVEAVEHTQAPVRNTRVCACTCDEEREREETNS